MAGVKAREVRVLGRRQIVGGNEGRRSSLRDMNDPTIMRFAVFQCAAVRSSPYAAVVE